jgi:thioredoxin reductase (NADPH)
MNIEEIETKDILIIGAGPVGLFMVFQAGMLGMTSVVVDCLEQLGGQCSALYPEKPIYDIPAYSSISGQGLTDALAEQAAPFNPKYYLGEKVISISLQEDNSYYIETTKRKLNTKAIVIAAGAGAFGPNRPPLDNIEDFEQKSIFYNITKRDNFANKDVVIAGGGDSAIDWAINLAEIAKSVSLVHRRSKFRGAPASLLKIKELAEQGKINLETPYQLDSISGQDGILQEVTIVDIDGKNSKSIKADYLLPFFGLAMNLGPILDWGLNLEKSHINVDPKNFATNQKNIYAVGDICTYPGKLKLILNGFGECSMAAHDIYKEIFPDKALHFEYSTTKGIKK